MSSREQPNKEKGELVSIHHTNGANERSKALTPDVYGFESVSDPRINPQILSLDSMLHLQRCLGNRVTTQIIPLSRHRSQVIHRAKEGLADLFGADEWVPTGGAPTAADFERLLNANSIDLNALLQTIPTGTPNTFQFEPRSQRGFKFEWPGWHIHGHEPDAGAQAGHVGGAGWIVRIQNTTTKEYLLSDTLISNFQPGHANYKPPTNWAKATTDTTRGRSHIPLTNV